MSMYGSKKMSGSRDCYMPDGHNPAIASVGRNGANDAARCQTANRNPYRFVPKAPHVGNPDNMRGGH